MKVFKNLSTVFGGMFGMLYDLGNPSQKSITFAIGPDINDSDIVLASDLYSAAAMTSYKDANKLINDTANKAKKKNETIFLQCIYN